MQSIVAKKKDKMIKILGESKHIGPIDNFTGIMTAY